ncbi:MAG: type IV secretory system conjugative DNA transfer family protein [Oscillospiraceae bacterium]|nr:type IV secretory system conjugative DNA transfer family protein [Oscillospiraceae bacterium]
MSKKHKESKLWNGDEHYLSPNERYELIKKEYPDVLPKISSKPGIFCGITPFSEKGEYSGIPLGSDGHMLVIGGSGSGKSSSIAKPTMKTWSAPMVVTDIKGELSEHYGQLYENGLVKRPYLVFDPMNSDGPGYDPFWWLMKDKSNLVSNIMEIAYAIVPEIPNNPNYYWDDGEREVLAAALLYGFNMGFSFGKSMCMIADCTLTELCKKLSNSTDIRIRRKIGDMLNHKAEQLASFDRGLRSRISAFVDDERIVRSLRSSRENANVFSWDDLWRYNIFLRVPEERIVQWGPIVNLMYSQLIHCLMRRPDKYSPGGASVSPVFLLMDEFARFGKLQMLPDAISTLRSKQVNICLIIQSLAQLDKIYGEDDRCIIADNCSYKAILGANDAETQKYLSELIGTSIVERESTSEHLDDYMDITGYSRQVSKVSEPTVPPAELAYLNDIILLSPYGIQKIPKYKGYDISDELYRFEIEAIPVSDDEPEIEREGEVFTTAEPENKDNEVVKMITVTERPNNTDVYFPESEHEQKLTVNAERVDGKKLSSKVMTVIGELVVKHFPLLSTYEYGKNKQDIEHDLQPLDAFMAELSKEKELICHIAEKVHFKEQMEGSTENSSEM